MAFCGKCGNPVESCTCVKSIGTRPVDKAGGFNRKFNDVSLGVGEQVVRQYNIGKSNLTSGAALVYVTNKRVILRQYSSYLGVSTNNMQDVTIDSITGTNHVLVRGFKVWKLVVAVIALILSMVMFSGGRLMGSLGPVWGIILMTIAVGFVLWARRPSYRFFVLTANTSPALETGVNLQGVQMSSNSNGVVFTLVPSQESVTMMLELSACIQDIKTKGDYAIDAWKNV